ncbi:MAG: CarD family transcriptional regulator [Clostridia bacterium]|nr:CarD family transcriptional regulator [Clostridia bacterium]
MFKVGDRIVYPMHGAGYIEGTEFQTVGGVQREYYNIHILGSNIRLKLPVDNTGPIRLRSVIDAKLASNVLDYFKNLEINTDVPWGKRYKENMERLKSGVPEETAEVVKTLMIRDREVGLSIGDRQVMLTAKNMFTAELALALGKEHEEIQNLLKNIVDKAIEK